MDLGLIIITQIPSNKLIYTNNISNNNIKNNSINTTNLMCGRDREDDRDGEDETSCCSSVLCSPLSASAPPSPYYMNWKKTLPCTTRDGHLRYRRSQIIVCAFWNLRFKVYLSVFCLPLAELSELWVDIHLLPLNETLTFVWGRLWHINKLCVATVCTDGIKHSEETD